MPHLRLGSAWQRLGLLECKRRNYCYEWTGITGIMGTTGVRHTASSLGSHTHGVARDGAYES